MVVDEKVICVVEQVNVRGETPRRTFGIRSYLEVQAREALADQIKP